MVMAIAVCPQTLARPGDFTDAAENVDVPPEHRAAPPGQPPQQPFPAQPPYQPRAIYPAVAPGTPQYPLFFTTQNGFVPFGSIYRGNLQPQAVMVPSPTYILPQDQPIVAPIVVATAAA